VTVVEKRSGALRIAQPSREEDRLLSIYLRDHFAGATAGVGLARRLRSSNRDRAPLRAPLDEICAEIEADRETLEEVMRRLGIRPSAVKVGSAWLAERIGRLKFNGRLRGYSPLSRLAELEALCMGITGKIQLWRAMERAFGREWEGFDFRQLSERAIRQRSTVEELHLRAVPFKQSR
jgi:hypothetical protein